MPNTPPRDIFSVQDFGISDKVRHTALHDPCWTIQSKPCKIHGNCAMVNTIHWMRRWDLPIESLTTLFSWLTFGFCVFLKIFQSFCGTNIKTSAIIQTRRYDTQWTDTYSFHSYPGASANPPRFESNECQVGTNSSVMWGPIGSTATREEHHLPARSICLRATYEKIMGRHCPTWKRVNYCQHQVMSERYAKPYQKRNSSPSSHHLPQSDRASCGGRKCVWKVVTPPLRLACRLLESCHFAVGATSKFCWGGPHSSSCVQTSVDAMLVDD